MKIYFSIFVLVLPFKTFAVNITFLVDTVNSMVKTVCSYEYSLTDTSYGTNGDTVLEYINLDKMIVSSGEIYINYGRNTLRYSSVKTNYGPSDTLCLSARMDSIEYYEYESQIWREMLADSTGKEILSNHWLAYKQMEEKGYIDYELLIDQIARIKPSEGYPIVDRYFPDTPHIRDSLRITELEGLSFIGMGAKLCSLYTEQNYKVNYKDPDSLLRDGYITDMEYFKLIDTLEIELSNGKIMWRFYVDGENYVVFGCEYSNVTLLRRTFINDDYKFDLGCSIQYSNKKSFRVRRTPSGLNLRIYDLRGRLIGVNNKVNKYRKANGYYIIKKGPYTEKLTKY